MTVVAVSMMKDEADICERLVRHMFAEGVDRMIVADNLSTDGTREILDWLADEFPLTVIGDPEVGYYQSSKTTHLVEMAGGAGADWVIPVDADEFWTATDGQPLAAALDASPYDVEYAQTFEYVSADRRLRDAKRLPKVAFRFLDGIRVHQGNHDVDHPGRRHRGLLRIDEFQYRSLVQLTRKVRNGRAAYEATDLPQYEGAHWRELGSLSDAELAAWWARYGSQDTVLDPPAFLAAAL